MPKSPTSAVLDPRNRFTDVDLAMAKAGRNNLPLWKLRVGKAIARALGLAGKTQKDLWVELGHASGSHVNAWIGGTENPNLPACFAIEWMRQPLVIALAELIEAGVDITTCITLQRLA